MGWSGPRTHLQYLCWLVFLGSQGAGLIGRQPAKQEPFDPFFSKEAVAKRQAEVDETLTVVPRAKAGGMDAGELLRAGISRLDEHGRAMRARLGIKDPVLDQRARRDGG